VCLGTIVQCQWSNSHTAHLTNGYPFTKRLCLLTIAQLINAEGVHESMDRVGQGLAIRDGVIVVVKSAVLPDGSCI
jgi:hypothetical protein